MSEYWVSHKRYFCKYCNIYIADDVPSRRQHEGGLRHKGNVERFVRGLYKEGEKRKQDSEEEKREMARVEKAAQAAFARDVSAGLVKPGSGSSSRPAASTSSTALNPATKPSNPYANYSTAESLGYVDPDAERLQAEAERRRTQGVAGDWEVVTPESTAASQPDPIPLAADNVTGVKREAEGPADEEDGRYFKLRRRTAGVGLGELYDPGLIPIKIKKKEELAETVTLSTSDNALQENNEGGRPKWSARGWSRPGENNAADGDEEKVVIENHDVRTSSTAEGDAAPSEAKEALPADVKVEAVKAEVDVPQAVAEHPPSTNGNLFRKRKLPVGGGVRGRRS